MRSVRLVYDAEGDILDVDFRLTGEKPRRGIELHDNVTIWTDAEEKNILRLILLSYSQLCSQPTLALSKLQKMPVCRRARLVELLTNEPIKRFLVSVDEKICRFRVVSRNRECEKWQQRKKRFPSNNKLTKQEEDLCHESVPSLSRRFPRTCKTSCASMTRS